MRGRRRVEALDKAHSNRAAGVVSGADQRYPADRSRGWAVPLTAFTLGAIAYGLSRIAAGAPGVVERVYAGGLWPFISRPISRATGVLPFSLAELLVTVYVVWMLYAIGSAVRNLFARRRRVTNALAGGVRTVLLHAGILTFAFYFIWGFNYSRPSLEQRQGWPEWEDADRYELILLATQAVDEANELYVEIHGSQDAGEPTRPPADMRPLEQALDQGWVEAGRLLSLQPVTGRPFGRVKRPFSSELIARLGITGIYSPFTAEANVLRGVPAMRLPHTMAHEQAHQRGITGEAEASFLGFAAAALSGDTLARYAAAMYAASQLLNSLASLDPELFASISSKRLPGPRRDLADLSAWIRRFDGVADRVATAVNDRYLRVNRVPGGVANYRRSVRLIIENSRHNGGSVLPERVQQ